MKYLEGRRQGISRIENATRWVVGCGLVAATTIAISPSLFAKVAGGPWDTFQPGGPWVAVTNTADCASRGRVCAEWPMSNSLALCCIEPSAVGTTLAPTLACDRDPVMALRDL